MKNSIFKLTCALSLALTSSAMAINTHYTTLRFKNKSNQRFICKTFAVKSSVFTTRTSIDLRPSLTNKQLNPATINVTGNNENWYCRPFKNNVMTYNITTSAEKAHPKTLLVTINWFNLNTSLVRQQAPSGVSLAPTTRAIKSN